MPRRIFSHLHSQSKFNYKMFFFFLFFFAIRCFSFFLKNVLESTKSYVCAVSNTRFFVFISEADPELYQNICRRVINKAL